MKNMRREMTECGNPVDWNQFGKVSGIVDELVDQANQTVVAPGRSVIRSFFSQRI